MVDERVVALGEGICGHTEAVGNPVVLAVGHQRRHGQSHVVVLDVIDHYVNVVGHVTLENETGLVDVPKVGWRNLAVGELVNLVALERVRPAQTVVQLALNVKLGNPWIELQVIFLVVVRQRVVVGQVQDELVLQLLNRHVRRIRSGDNLEAVVKQRLRLVIRNAHELDTFFWITCCRSRPDHTHRDVVVVTRLECKRSRSLDEASVGRGVA